MGRRYCRRSEKGVADIKERPKILKKKTKMVDKADQTIENLVSPRSRFK